MANDSHLDLNAPPTAKCTKCGRSTWEPDPDGGSCWMRQPDGSRCAGIFTTPASTLRDEITTAINRTSAENGSDTPDYILAAFLANCLAAFDMATKDRDQWHGFKTWTTTPTTPTTVADESGAGA